MDEMSDPGPPEPMRFQPGPPGYVLVPEGEIFREHCRSCNCFLFAKDIMMVKVHGDLVRELSGGWSAPVRIRVELEADGTWEMTCMTVEGQEPHG